MKKHECFLCLFDTEYIFSVTKTTGLFLLARLGTKACLILFPRNDIYRIVTFLEINAGNADNLFQI